MAICDSMLYWMEAPSNVDLVRRVMGRSGPVSTGLDALVRHGCQNSVMKLAFAQETGYA